MKHPLPLLALFSLLVACQAPAEKNAAQQSASAKPQAATLLQLTPHFYVGAAVSEQQIMDKTGQDLGFIPTQFNAVTAENDMKWERLQPTEGEYHWEVADRLVEFTEQHNLHLTGHVFLWHQQTPDWVFQTNDGAPAGRTLVLKRLKAHINTVAKRYHNKIPAWDVVNEALNEDGTLRNSKWLTQIGEDYIELAFQYAHEAAPDAELIYNDYNLFKPEKRQGALRIIQSLQDKGIPIHGVGMQAHYAYDYPSDLKEVEDSIMAFANTGLKIHITELDLSVLPFPDKDNQGADISLDIALNETFNPFAEGLNRSRTRAFNQQYTDLFKIFFKHKNKIERITFWGVTDGDSWRNDWPMKGRTDYPLLIDRNRQLKPTAFDIFELANQLSAPNPHPSD